MEDDSQDSHLIAQITNEVLAVVAPLNTAVSYSVYMVPCYDGDDDELNAYKVFSLIKCVNPESISSELHAHLETVLKERSLYSTSDWEISVQYLAKSSTSLARVTANSKYEPILAN